MAYYWRVSGVDVVFAGESGFDVTTGTDGHGVTRSGGQLSVSGTARARALPFIP